MKKAYPREISVGSASAKVYRMRKPYKLGDGTTVERFLYRVTWYDGPVRKEAAFADEAAALLEARVKASQIATGRTEGADMSRSDRDELIALRKLAGDVPPMAAMSEWQQARDLTAGNVLIAAKAWAAKQGKVEQRVDVSAVVAEFLKVKTAAGKNVATDHKYVFDRIRAELGSFSIGSVSARQLDSWLGEVENPVSRNTQRKRLTSIWRWAQRKGYLPRDARTEAEMTDAAHEPPPVIGIIDVATWSRLLAYFRAEHPEFLAPLVVAGFCGLRRREVSTQTWEDISTERKNLRVTGAKRGTPARRMVPLSDAAAAWLNVCPGDHKAELGHNSALDRVRRLAAGALTEDGKALFPPLPPNCFRHAYVSHAVAGTGDIPRVSLQAGNSPGQINRHYRELVSEADGKAWFAVLPA